MEQTPLPEGEDARLAVLKREYWCFISYRHADNKVEGRKWATWLHQALETYEVPGDLVGTKNERGDVIPERIFPVFRDEEELPADAELSAPIEGALVRSRFMVVLCSPQAVQSSYVANEILRFKQLGKSNRILAAILEGEPNATDDPAKGGVAKECFPQPLRFACDAATGQLTTTRTEPVAADFRLADGSPGWTTIGAYRVALKEAGLDEAQMASRIADYAKQQNLMLLKIVAGVLGLPLGTLTARDKAYQLEKQRQKARTLRNWLLLVGAVGVAAIVAGLLAYVNGKEAEEQRDVAKTRQAEAEEQRGLATQRSKMLSDNLGHYLFKEGSARLRSNATANEGLAFLARAVREHGHATSANRLLTFMQQRPVWMLEDIGEAEGQASPSQAVLPLPKGFQGPVIAGNTEPGKADLRVKGPNGLLAVSWAENMDAPESMKHQGQGLHHFRVWDAAGAPLTEWLWPEYEADHWVGDISRMVFSPDGQFLAVTVSRWRQPEYLLLYDIKKSRVILEPLVATGEDPKMQGARFTEVFFTPMKEQKGVWSCQFIAATDRGDAYWAQVHVSKSDEARGASAYTKAVANHRTAVRSAYVIQGEKEKLVTASEDGEVRFTEAQFGTSRPPEPYLRMARPVTRITDGGGEGNVLMESDGRQYRAILIRPAPFAFELPVKRSKMFARIENDKRSVTLWNRGEVLSKTSFRTEVKSVAAREDPPSLWVKLDDGSTQTFYLNVGRLELSAAGRGHEVILEPQGRAQKHAVLGLVDAVVPTDKVGRYIVTTKDLVYQLFELDAKEPLSKPMDERLLFQQGGVASEIDQFMLSPSGKVMLSRSKFWDAPNLMTYWVTLWDCATGEPLSDRLTFGDEETGTSEESKIFSVSDTAATVGGNVIYEATPEMYAALADLAENLAGMELDGQGELRRKRQARGEVLLLQEKILEMGKR